MTQVEDGRAGINPLQTGDGIFVMAGALSAGQAIAFVTSLQPLSTVPSSFMALCNMDMGFEEALDEIIAREGERIADDIAYRERSLLRGERRRPWDRHTRGPFRGILGGEGVPLGERLALAERVVGALGVPDALRERGRGRRRKFSAGKLIAAVLAKGNLSFVDLAAELREMGYDATVDGSRASPSKSTLFKAFAMLPREYLEEALRALDDMTAELYGGFGEDMNVFAGDNSAVPCDDMVVRNVKGRGAVLMRDTFDFYALVRLPTNTIRLITEHRNLILRTVQVIPRGSTLLLDAEFDAEMNYWLAHRMGIQVMINPRGRPRWFVGTFLRFEGRVYGRRKLVERTFGNITKRRTVSYFRSFQGRIKGIMLAGILHNMISYYRSVKWTGLFLRAG
ncbi:hypothetical protein [Conexivisphaera calida]|uniref:Uncharacterized protein n=1 Tax=Conexivisphaera calida TaxID=1874277 RepID=A0A4P2VND0_9ARCH|nr:hypothetical protein [Conexivisphaera calida]BBE42435.1 hypothetical protein NAS2_1046 [Conexivisphaera calida]